MPDTAYSVTAGDEGHTLLPEIRDAYRILSCLKSSATGATYLCENKETGQRVIIKTQSAGADGTQLKNEDRMLRRIHSSGQPMSRFFPHPIAFQTDGKTDVLIREFIPGESVAAYVESGRGKPGTPREWAVKCVSAVLQQVSFLHRLRPPVIHRDIKPQNVVIDREGHFHLIDLGISRQLKTGSPCDTQIMGSSLTAPPEQFGYRQTDERSDIYSAGVLLRYCLTQEYGQEADRDIDPDLRAIIQKATRFDPDMRYRQAEDMLTALQTLKPKRHTHGKTRVAAALAALALTVSVLILLLSLNAGQPEIYRFREPLLEQAVREALQKPTGDLTRDDLTGVTGLHIFGRQIYSDESEFWFIGRFTLPYDTAMRSADFWQENGGIVSLEDVRALPNLKELCLYRQQIEDLSPVADSEITCLGIGFNPVTDFSPLRGNKNLTTLNLTCASIADASIIASIPNLTALSVAGTEIRRLRPLADLPLRELNLVDVTIEDGEVLSRMQELEKLTVSKLYPGLLMQIQGLRLRTLEVTHAQEGVSLRELESIPTLERLSYSSDEPETITGEPLYFPLMQELEIKNAQIASLTCLAMMRNLRVLNISESECMDWAGLDRLSRLGPVICTETQRAALLKRYPEAAWQLLIP